MDQTPITRTDTDTTRERARVEVKFFPGCLILSIVLSVVGTILLNVLLRAFN